MTKVLFQCNAISPYRNNFFNYLAKICDLTVVYETENYEHSHRDQKWFEGLTVEYNKVKIDKKKVFGKFYKGDILPLLKQERFDVVILGNYLSFTGFTVAKYCKRKKIKVAVSADGALGSGSGSE